MGEGALVSLRRPGFAGVVCISLLGVCLFASPAIASVVDGMPGFQSGTAEDSITKFVSGLGGWAFVVAPLFMISVAVLPFPAEIPAMLNGVLFGPVLGTFASWSGALVGAMISFELARRFGRPIAERFLESDTVDRADTLVQSAGWPVLLVLRLVPTVAFTAINWAAGFTAIRRTTFLWTTALGILPGAIVFTASGTGLAALYRMNPAAGWTLVLAGLVAIGWTVIRCKQAFNRPPAVPIDS